MVGDMTDQKPSQSGKLTPLWRLDQKSFPLLNSERQFTREESWRAFYLAFVQYGHTLWETTKPTGVLTENKLVERLFHAKAFPPTL